MSYTRSADLKWISPFPGNKQDHHFDTHQTRTNYLFNSLETLDLFSSQISNHSILPFNSTCLQCVRSRVGSDVNAILRLLCVRIDTSLFAHVHLSSTGLDLHASFLLNVQLNTRWHHCQFESVHTVIFHKFSQCQPDTFGLHTTWKRILVRLMETYIQLVLHTHNKWGDILLSALDKFYLINHMCFIRRKNGIGF